MSQRDLALHRKTKIQNKPLAETGEDHVELHSDLQRLDARALQINHALCRMPRTLDVDAHLATQWYEFIDEIVRGRTRLGVNDPLLRLAAMVIYEAVLQDTVDRIRSAGNKSITQAQ